MFRCVLFGFDIFFKGVGFPETPSFIPSGTKATKVTLIKLTSQMNSFSVVFFLFFTQDVLSMVNIIMICQNHVIFLNFFMFILMCHIKYY